MALLPLSGRPDLSPEREELGRPMVVLFGRRKSLIETEEGRTLRIEMMEKWSLEPVRLWQSVLQKGKNSPGK